MASVDKDPTRTKTPWVVRWRDESGRQRKRGFPRKIDADRFRAQVEHQLQSGTYVDHAAGAVTFAAFFAEWSSRQVWESTTDRAMRLAARSVTFDKVSVRQLRRSHVEAWVKAMQTKGLAPGTVKTRFNNVRSVLRAAVRDRIIAADPAVGVTLPRTRRVEAAMLLPTAAQVRALFEAAEPAFTAFIALCAFAGLRLGEAAAMQVSDIDFLRRQVEVRRQVQRAGVEWSRSGRRSTAASALCSSPRPWWTYLPSTSLDTAIHAAGCSPARVTTRLIRTRSATGGARHGAEQVRTSCDFTT